MSADQYPVLSQKGDLTLLHTDKYADVKVSFHGISLKLHRSILSRCSWFKEKFDMIDTVDGIQMQLNDFSPGLFRTFFRFIYTTELRHESLKPEDGKFDYELHAELYNMGTYFNFLEFKAALVDMGVSCLNKDIRHYKARPRKLSQAKIDQLLSAVGVAYSGTFNNQATLREMYVHFFTECFDSVQQDKYFHSAIGLVKQFSLDLMRSVNRKAGKTVMTVPIKTTATNPPGATATKPPTMTGAITRAKPPAATAASSTDETDTSTESDSDSSTDSDSDFDADSESESIYETANEFEVAVKATVSRALASATRSLLAASASGLKATARR